MDLIEFKDKPDLSTPINKKNLNHNFNEIQNKINIIDEKSVYSAEEKEIGTWINGYKVYRKVIQVVSSIKNGDNVIPVDIKNLGMLINSRMYNNNANYTFPYHSSIGYTFLQNVTPTSITIRSTDTWSECLWTFILEYTKTE